MRRSNTDDFCVGEVDLDRQWIMNKDRFQRNKMSNTEVNKENSIVTYILQLDVKGENEAIKNL